MPIPEKRTSCILSSELNEKLHNLKYIFKLDSRNDLIQALIDRYEINNDFIDICIMFKNGHSSDALIEKLSEILQSYGIDEDERYYHIQRKLGLI